MGQCPVCAAPVADDFGLTECSQCGAQLVVHMDGRVEHHGAEVAEPASEDVPDMLAEPIEFIEPIREFEPEPETEPETAVTNAQEGALAEEGLGEIDPMAVLDEAEGDQPAATYAPSQVAPSSVDSVELQDVANFANSPDSGGQAGTLRYTLFIEGIDTADVREAFKEAITDKKLMWDIDNILRTIKQGEVKIENVSSAKAFIVVTRLKLLPLKVSWEQHAMHEA